VPSDSGFQRVTVDSTEMVPLMERVLTLHPEVRKADGKLAQAEAERALARLSILPLASADLSALSAVDGGQFQFGEALSRSGNFKGVIELASPLLFFKERGKFRSTDAKAERADLEVQLTRREVTLLVRTAINDLVQFDAQLSLQRDAVRLFRILSAGERTKFEAGESTLFLVNTRERQVLDEELKYVALQAKYVAARAALAVALGAPGRLPNW
jgi:outer membrane protein TolC